MAKRPKAPSRAKFAADTAASDTSPVWEESVGSIPYKVTVFEMASRKRVLYLRWRRKGQWKYKALTDVARLDRLETATLYDANGNRLTGRALDVRKKWARAQAEAKFAELKAGLSPAEKIEATPLTLGETWAVITDPHTGRYPSITSHRNEVQREWSHVVRILGEDRAWATVKRADLRRLWRSRINELRDGGSPKARGGLRGAEITVTRMLAVSQWLRDEEKIPADACVAASTWRQSLKDDWLDMTGEDRLPKPHRPRFTPDEFRKLLSVAWDVDPRFGLAYTLGAELRGGQIRRARRSDLTLPSIGDTAPADDNYGSFNVVGRGKKGGTVVLLTKGQRAAVDRALHHETGYLRELEAARMAGEIADYFLFPAGQMPGLRLYRVKAKPTRGSRYHGVPDHPLATVERHANASASEYAFRMWFMDAQRRAEIPHVSGRLWHGGRRAGVDMAKAAKISREALEEHGGWSDSQVPDRIYADEQRDYARKEARDARAKYRGEPVDSNPSNDQDQQ